MPNIMKNWPEWAWVCKHAENSKNDHLYVRNHIFPHAEYPSYCRRTWGPQEYINWRIEILKREAEDLQKLIQLFEIPEQHNEIPLIPEAICPAYSENKIHLQDLNE